MKRRVALGFLGTKLDTGTGEERWKKWRPTIALCQQNGLFIDRLELIHGPASQNLAQRIIEDIEVVSPATEVNLHLIEMADPWDFSEVYTSLRDFVRSYSFEPDEEDYLVNITTGTHVAQICWFLLTEARYVPGRLLQLTPPNRSIDPDDFSGTHTLIDLDLSRYDEIASRFASEREEDTSFLKSGISTRNATFNAMISEIERVVIRSSAPVLLCGPTGAGKSQLARRIYELKKAKHQLRGRLVEVNCATLHGDQAMSALFGHVKGAFTGAQAEREGLLRAADGGLLFLDEIGELGLDEQAMCLRAIEEKRFLPVGADREVESRFQLIAGTNRDLNEEVRKGRFREDLLARLNLWSFVMPALSERKEDIEPNLDFELRRFSQNEGQNVTMNKEARLAYLTFATGSEGLWQANFRDLSASVTRMATLSDRGRITIEVARAEIDRLRKNWQGGKQENTLSNLTELLGEDAQERYDRFDLIQLEDVIRVCKSSNNLSAAGRTLFSASARLKKSSNDADRLRKYLARFGLSFEEVRNGSR